MSSCTLRAFLLGAAILAIGFVACAQSRAQEKNTPALAAAMKDARTTMEQGLGTADKTGRPISAKRLHMILSPIADYSILLDYDVTSALEAASTIAAAPFEIGFNRLQSFVGADGYPLALRCGDGLVALTGLRKALSAALTVTGPRLDENT